MSPSTTRSKHTDSKDDAGLVCLMEGMSCAGIVERSQDPSEGRGALVSMLGTLLHPLRSIFTVSSAASSAAAMTGRSLSPGETTRAPRSSRTAPRAAIWAEISNLAPRTPRFPQAPVHDARMTMSASASGHASGAGAETARQAKPITANRGTTTLFFDAIAKFDRNYSRNCFFAAGSARPALGAASVEPSFVHALPRGTSPNICVLLSGCVHSELQHVAGEGVCTATHELQDGSLVKMSRSRSHLLGLRPPPNAASCPNPGLTMQTHCKCELHLLQHDGFIVSR